MDEKLAQVCDELFPFFEALETQNAALLQFLKDKGIVNDEVLRPYLEQAANTSSVRWLAARVRINGLLASHGDSGEKVAAKKSPAPESKPEATKPEAKSSDPATEERPEKPRGKDAQDVQKSSGSAKDEKEDSAKTAAANSEKSQTNQGERGKNARSSE
jgi:hypothetical protein